MTTIRLERFAYLDDGTFGTIVLPSGLSLFTVERPWIENQRSVSCIPEGVYPLVPDRYNRGGYDAFELRDVPDRSQILIHIANWPQDVQGCIGVGTGLEITRKMVTNSRVAFGKLMNELTGRVNLDIDISVKRAIL